MSTIDINKVKKRQIHSNYLAKMLVKNSNFVHHICLSLVQCFTEYNDVLHEEWFDHLCAMLGEDYLFVTNELQKELIQLQPTDLTAKDRARLAQFLVNIELIHREALR